MTRTIPLILAILLAACGSGPVGNSSSSFDKGFRDSYRARFTADCIKAGKDNTGKDFTTICNCVVDKLFATKNAAELMSGPPDDEFKRLGAQCAREHPLS